MIRLENQCLEVYNLFINYCRLIVSLYFDGLLFIDIKLQTPPSDRTRARLMWTQKPESALVEYSKFELLGNLW